MQGNQRDGHARALSSRINLVRDVNKPRTIPAEDRSRFGIFPKRSCSGIFERFRRGGRFAYPDPRGARGDFAEGGVGAARNVPDIPSTRLLPFGKIASRGMNCLNESGP